MDRKSLPLPASRSPDTAGAATEARNTRTDRIDTVPTLELLRMLNAEDALVAPAVARVLPDLAVVVDATVARLQAGGSVHYFGAGSSGRIGMLDAAEVVPTFGAGPGVFVAHHAGGSEAVAVAVETAEDDEALGAAAAAGLGANDVAVGLTASGRTPFVAGALRGARAAGALTVLVSSNMAERAEDGAERSLYGVDGPARANVFQPDGVRGRDERKTCPAADHDADASLRGGCQRMPRRVGALRRPATRAGPPAVRGEHRRGAIGARGRRRHRPRGPSRAPVRPAARRLP